MKQYEVKITDEALGDMGKIYEHIACVLLSPENALGQYNRIADAILKLDMLPERFKIMDSEPEHSRGIRRMLVDNYSVFYNFPNNGRKFRCIFKWIRKLVSVCR